MAANETSLYGGLEAGGTKWVCAVGTGPHHVPGALGGQAGVLGAIVLAQDTPSPG